MLAAPGVRCVCSDVPRSKSDRVRVENALCRPIRLTARGADDVRTAFWRTTGTKRGTKIPHAPDGVCKLLKELAPQAGFESPLVTIRGQASNPPVNSVMQMVGLAGSSCR